MSKYVCQLCNKMIFSQSVTFAAGALTINIPAGSYNRDCNYCLVIAQTIPDTATIAAPVNITIGDGTEPYPLVNACCAPVTACGIRTRTRYAVRVATSATGGSFKMLGRPCCSPDYSLAAIDGTAPATGGGAG